MVSCYFLAQHRFTAFVQSISNYDKIQNITLNLDEVVKAFIFGSLPLIIIIIYLP